jgi:hypothetical protein
MTDQRRQRVVIETERLRIAGEVVLPAEGIRTRLSDLLNRQGLAFVAVVDATISDHDGNLAVERPFIAVARDHIVIAYEDDEPH